MILSLVFFTFSFVFYLVTALLYIGHWVFRKWISQTATAMACRAPFNDHDTRRPGR